MSCLSCHWYGPGCPYCYPESKSKRMPRPSKALEQFLKGNPSMSNETEREAFEAWLLSLGVRPGHLTYDSRHWAWRAWQARAAAFNSQGGE